LFVGENAIFLDSITPLLSIKGIFEKFWWMMQITDGYLQSYLKRVSLVKHSALAERL
jgi:hypothetical protein